jgi:hypothetical protein
MGHALVEGGERAAVEEVRRVHRVPGSAKLVGERHHARGESLDMVEEDDLSHRSSAPVR